MAQISKPPVPWKMYRHFAVVTVLLTAGLAMFAHGENAEYTAAQTAPAPAPQARATPRASSTPAYGEAHFSRREGGGFSDSSEFDTSYGQPMDSNASMGFDSANVPPPNSENAGFTPAYLDTLSELELEQLLANLREGGIENDAERRQAMMVLEAASRRRSGHRATP